MPEDNTPQHKTEITRPEELLERINAGKATTQIDLSNLIIKCKVNFCELFKQADFKEIPQERQASLVVCPFVFRANGTEFKQDVSFASVQFSMIADFSSAELSGNANFDFAQFEEVAYFWNARFEKGANFDSAQFSGEADFSAVQFLGKADFESAHFSGEANFRSTQFSGVAFFSSAELLGETYFRSARFSGEAYFWNARFEKGANFDSARFEKGANFYSARFEEGVSFYSAQFSGEAYFESAQFSREAYFKFAQFSKKVFFNKLKLFNNSQFNFFRISFSPDTRLYFEFERSEQTCSQGQVELCGIRSTLDNSFIYITDLTDDVSVTVSFHDCQFHDKNVRLTNVSLKDKIKVTGSYGWRGFVFDDCHWPKTPVAKFSWWENVLFPWFQLAEYALPDEERFQPAKPKSAQGETKENNASQADLSETKKTSLQAKKDWSAAEDTESQPDTKTRASTYGMLKTVARSQGDMQLATSFYCWQMIWQLRHAVQDRHNLWRHSPWKMIYLLTSGFGTSVARPVICFVVSFVLFLISYFLIGWVDYVVKVMFSASSCVFLESVAVSYIHFVSSFGTSVARPVICFVMSFVLFALGYLWLGDAGTRNCVAQITTSSPCGFSGPVATAYIHFALDAANPFIWTFKPDAAMEVDLQSGWSLALRLLFFLHHALSVFLIFQLGAAIRNRVRQ